MELLLLIAAGVLLGPTLLPKIRQALAVSPGQIPQTPGQAAGLGAKPEIVQSANQSLAGTSGGIGSLGAVLGGVAIVAKLAGAVVERQELAAADERVALSEALGLMSNAQRAEYDKAMYDLTTGRAFAGIWWQAQTREQRAQWRLNVATRILGGLTGWR